MNVNLFLNKNSDIKVIEIKTESEWINIYNNHNIDPYNHPNVKRDKYGNIIPMEFPFLVICDMDTLEIEDKNPVIYLNKDQYELPEECYFIRRSDGMYFKEMGEVRSSPAFSRKYGLEELKHAKETCSLLNAMEDIKDVSAERNGEKSNGFYYKVIDGITKRVV